ncbi:hypothetical protein G4G28_11985 [Massilia sp. Dwa41.01b]|uniref:hypothetical protein n=1 Tax=Massilia sp. Dwa41.01b TaxID=2709302 RepID=UPI001861E59A|nr:hypothetical protein G4G28_11985 [Massilia sp. Dwa41.01b]
MRTVTGQGQLAGARRGAARRWRDDGAHVCRLDAVFQCQRCHPGSQARKHRKQRRRRTRAVLAHGRGHVRARLVGLLLRVGGAGVDEPALLAQQQAVQADGGAQGALVALRRFGELPRRRHGSPREGLEACTLRGRQARVHAQAQGIARAVLRTREVAGERMPPGVERAPLHAIGKVRRCQRGPQARPPGARGRQFACAQQVVHLERLA